jgi:hypothetical protein
MAPYEYRVKCTPDATAQQAYLVEVFIARSVTRGEPTEWRSCFRQYIDLRDAPHNPYPLWREILHKIKVA